MSLVSFPSWGLTLDDLVERGGLYYKKFSDVPFTDQVNEERRKGSIKNGQYDGSWVYYYGNGQLLRKGNFKNDEREGLWEGYHENGRLFYKGNYRNGKKEDFWESYNEDGTINLQWNGTFKNGVKVSD